MSLAYKIFCGLWKTLSDVDLQRFKTNPTFSKFWFRLVRVGEIEGMLNAPYKVYSKQTLESLNPRILDPFLPTIGD